MVGAEPVQHVKHAARGSIHQRLGGAAPSLHWVPRRADIEQHEPAVFADSEAGNRVVAAVGRQKKPSIWREDNAIRAFESVGRALLAADRFEHSRTGAARGSTIHLGNCAVRGPPEVDDEVLWLVRLN